jgi:dihydropteroate synthase
MLLRARQFEFTFPRPTLLMGVVNVTPDSFYPGARFQNESAAIDHALRLIEAGADMIDIGGESSRPGAESVSEEEELHRVLPVIAELAPRIKIPISIDTIKPSVARAAVSAGASIINDIAANREDDEMWRIVAETGAGYVVVHMQGSPATMQKNPFYADVLADVGIFFEDRLERLSGCGVNPEQVILDVGLGFGKRVEDNLRLLGELERFRLMARPLLIGASRKSFVGTVSGATVEERLSPSLACASWAAQHGAAIVRCHDVAATRQAVRMTEALMKQQTK